MGTQSNEELYLKYKWPILKKPKLVPEWLFRWYLRRTKMNVVTISSLDTTE